MNLGGFFFRDSFSLLDNRYSKLIRMKVKQLNNKKEEKQKDKAVKVQKSNSQLKTRTSSKE